MAAFVITNRKTSDLTPSPRNPRTHSRNQVHKIAESLKAFGFTNPILIDENSRIIAGHGRLLAAKLLKLKSVPTLRIDHLSDAQKRAYIIADNRLAELAGWDEEMLAKELGELLELDLDFDITLSGFEIPEIDVLLEKLDDSPEIPSEDPVPLPRKGPAVSREGDLWILGNHRLYCGNALDAEAVQTLMGREKAGMGFTDPPYNVPIEGHVCKTRRPNHKEFPMAAGEMSEEEFTAFLETAFRNMARFSKDGSIHFIFMDWRHLREILDAGKQAYTELKNLCVWAKTNAGLGNFYRSQHELVLVFKYGKAPHQNNIRLSKSHRYRTNLWTYQGVNTLGNQRENLALHPTVKPLTLVADAIRDCSKRHNIILDPFAGSGTTILAAEITGRRCNAIELDAAYVDLCIWRWQEMTKKEVKNELTGETFKETAKSRNVPVPTFGRKAA